MELLLDRFTGKGPAVRASMLVVVFISLSAIVATAICRTSIGAIAQKDSARSFKGEPLLGPNEFLPQIMAKTEVTKSVIRGELELIEAAKTFRDLSTNDEDYARRMRVDYPEADEIEIYARSVISHVRVQLRGKPELETTIERLNTQLAYYQEQIKPNRAG
jgi:hypothetical protein